MEIVKIFTLIMVFFVLLAILSELKLPMGINPIYIENEKSKKREQRLKQIYPDRRDRSVIEIIFMGVLLGFVFNLIFSPNN